MTPEIEQLIHDVLHGDATEADRDRLSAWILADEANAKLYLRVAMDERAIRSNLERDSSRSVEALAESPDDSGAGLVLAELGAAEAKVHPPLVELIELKGSWVRDHALPLITAAGVALAAMIAIAVIVLVGPSDSADTGQPLVSDTPVAPVPLIGREAQAVATLTDAQDAFWAEGAFAPGSQLYAGDRLTLTEGFAEITTNRGAIAILEAPATIELLDNDNALRLYAGKLVGICESESSKGFVVRTAQMDITDLGTRFGVALDNKGSVLTHVFMGSVLVKTVSDEAGSIENRVLTANQSVVVDDRGRLAPRERFASTPFESLYQRRAPIVPAFYTYGDNDSSRPAPLSHGNGIISDPDTNKLNDNVLTITAEGQAGAHVGFRNDVDNGQPQPRIDFSLGGLFDVDTVTIYSLAEFQSAADESVRVYSSTDGVNYSDPVVSPIGTPWTDGPDDLRQLVIDASSLPDGSYIRIEIFDKDQWTIISEIDFQGTPVPPLFERDGA